MSEVRRLAERVRLYGITPDSLHSAVELRQAIAAAAKGGLTAIQYRHKLSRAGEVHEQMARTVVDVASEFQLLSIINDDPELAVAVGADGVHLGVEDADIAAVRAQFGDDLIIGASTPSIASARAAVSAGADYLGVGAIFDAHASKPDASDARGLRWLARFRAEPALEGVPIVAIGGVTAANCRSCVEHGADGVASIRGVFGGDSPQSSTRRMARAISGV